MTESDKRPPPPPDFDVMPDDDLPPQRKSNTAQGVWIVVGMFLVLGLLVVLTGPILLRMLFHSDVSAAEAQMSMFEQAINDYRLDHKKLPASLMDLTKTSGRNPHPYMPSIPDDPWGNPYQYHVLDKTTFQIRSAGEDGMLGTGDDVVYPPEWR